MALESLTVLRAINAAQAAGTGTTILREYLQQLDHARGYKSDLRPRVLEPKGPQRNPQWREALDKLAAKRRRP